MTQKRRNKPKVHTYTFSYEVFGTFTIKAKSRNEAVAKFDDERTPPLIELIKDYDEFNIPTIHREDGKVFRDFEESDRDDRILPDPTKTAVEKQR